MLVLSRKLGETIVITTTSGDHVEVAVMEIRGDKVRLGVEADKAIVIHRGEVQAAIDEQRNDADQTTAPQLGS